MYRITTSTSRLSAYKSERGSSSVAATIQEEQLSDYPELADLMAEWSATGHVTLTVVPLERAHIGEFVRTMSATGELADESIVDRLFRLTGGNPFFLREAVSLVTQSPGSPLAGDVVLPRADAILRRRLEPNSGGDLLGRLAGFLGGGQDMGLGAVQQVGGEEVACQDRLGLGAQELRPGTICPPRCGVDPGLLSGQGSSCRTWGYALLSRDAGLSAG
jgi:hypothetical protein